MAYTIEKSSAWFSVLFDENGNGVTGQSWVTATKPSGSSSTWNVTPTSTFTDSAAAKNFAEWLSTRIPSSEKGTALEGETPKASNLDKGYYLVTSSLGSNLILATTDVEIYEKNQYPGSEKTQSTQSNGTYATTEITREIGQTVYYHVDITIPATATKAITVTDTMSKGLTLQNTGSAITWSATSKAGEAAATAITTSDITGWNSLPATWTADSGNPASDGSNKYTVTIPDSIVKALAAKAGDTTTVTLTLAYTAEVNKDAVIAGDGNTNTASIKYDNFTTKDSTVTTKVYDFNLVKEFVDSKGTKVTGSDNYQATFTLTRKDESTAMYFTSAAGEASDAYTTQYTVAKSDTDGASQDITVKGDAKGVNFKGVAAGTYTLTETATQNGYNKLTSAITVTVAADGKVSFTNPNSDATAAAAELSAKLTVQNKAGSVLPSTGGIGTTIFYILGGVLVAGAAVLLIFRRRKRA